VTRPTVLSSILDFPRKTLSQKLWVYDSPEDLPHLDPELRDLILDNAKKSLEQFDAKLLGCLLYGGSASYQWTDGADVDVSLYIDWDAVEHSFEEIEPFFKKIELPFRGHPVHLYVKPPDQKEQFEVADAYYDVLHNEWVLPPLVLPKDFDPDKYFKPLMKAAQKKAEKIDEKIGELRRSWKILEKSHDALPEARDPKVVQERIETERTETKKIAQWLADEFIKVREKRYALHDKLREQISQGKDVGRLARFQEPEVIWKYLDRAGYNDFLYKIRKALDDGTLDAILKQY
jgi:hypothetical protein